MRLIPTGEMTLGPFFPREFAEGANDLAAGVREGEVIEITGRITQVDGRPLDSSRTAPRSARPTALNAASAT